MSRQTSWSGMRHVSAAMDDARRRARTLWVRRWRERPYVSSARPIVIGGCVVFGMSMAGWMLPVGLLRAATPASQVAWRTAVFRVFVDGGMFLGPFASGLLGPMHPRVLPTVLAAALCVLGVTLLARASAGRPRRAEDLAAASARRGGDEGRFAG